MTLHLVRHADPPPGAVAERDAVLYERDGAWILGAEVVSDEALVELVFRADRVVVW